MPRALIVPHGGRQLFVLTSVVFAAACAPTTARPRPFPLPNDRPAPEVATRVDEAAPDTGLRAGGAVTDTALALRGAPYLNGGAGPSGFDCSGFVQYVFRQHQLLLPRDVREQARIGTSIDRAQIAAGDLLFFSTVASGPSHVGIALDGNRFVHAPSERGVVRVEALALPYWNRRYVGARRVP